MVSVDMWAESSDTSSTNENQNDPLINGQIHVIGICGASASGKTTLCNLIRDNVCPLGTAFVPADCFYKSLSVEQKEKAMKEEFDFDHPDAIDWELVKQTTRIILEGRGVIQLPVYDFTTHSRASSIQFEESVDSTLKDKELNIGQNGGTIIRCSEINMVIVEGILIFAADSELRSMLNLKIYVEADSDLRLALRLKRDVESRGRSVDSVIRQYLRFVKPSFENFVDPSKRYADIIIPNHFDPYNVQSRTGLSESALSFILTSIKKAAKNIQVKRTRSLRSINDVSSPQDRQLITCSAKGTDKSSKGSNVTTVL